MPKRIRKGGKTVKKVEREDYLKTGIEGLDKMLERGIPKGSSILIAGGTGSGKTILCLEMVANAAKMGEKCLYMTFEESEKKLKDHMEDFSWNPKSLEKEGKLMITRPNPHDVSRTVEAMLAKERGELMIDIAPVIIPAGFKPDRIVIDSLTAISASFMGKEHSYRSYITQMFRYLEKLDITSFLIVETEEVPKVFSPHAVEEFLADGVFVLYSLQKGDLREHAIEVLKLRGAKHSKKIMGMDIVDGKGVVVNFDE